MIDLLAVRKDENGELEVLQESDLTDDEATEFGALIGALVGLGAGGEEEASIGALAGAAELADGHVFDDAEIWYLGDAIPDGGAAAVALLEHRWAIPLRDKIIEAGGVRARRRVDPPRRPDRGGRHGRGGCLGLRGMTAPGRRRGRGAAAEPSAAPSRAPLVLVALILVAAVANLNLVGRERRPAVDRPGVRLVADDPQPDRGRLLARPRGVGALARGDRRPLRAQAPAARRHAARRSRCPARRVRAVGRRARSPRGSSAASPPAWPTRPRWR